MPCVNYRLKNNGSRLSWSYVKVSWSAWNWCLNLDSKHKAFILMDAWILVQRHSVRGKGIMDVWDLLLLAFIFQPKEFQAVFNRRPCTPDGFYQQTSSCQHIWKTGLCSLRKHMRNGGMIWYTPLKTSMEGPKMMVWKMYLLLERAMFGIYVKFLGCSCSLWKEWVNHFITSLCFETLRVLAVIPYQKGQFYCLTRFYT